MTVGDRLQCLIVIPVKSHSFQKIPWTGVAGVWHYVGITELLLFHSVRHFPLNCFVRGWWHSAVAAREIRIYRKSAARIKN